MSANGLLFLFGGGVYAAIELLYRQRTYFSMFCAGGTSLLLIDRWCNRGSAAHKPLAVRCVMGSAAITLIELLFGLVFNRTHKEWNYSEMPMNLLGQICLPFSFIWSMLSLPAMGAAKVIRRAME